MIHIFFLITFLYGTSAIFGMELCKENFFNKLAKETTIKIAASIQPSDRNSLSWTCKEYNERFSKKNYANILFQQRCILSLKDQAYYLREFAKENKGSLVKNLIQNGQDHRALDIISLFKPCENIKQLLMLYTENKDDQALDELMPHVMNVYKGDQSTWNKYVCNHDRIYKQCFLYKSCPISIPFVLLIDKYATYPQNNDTYNKKKKDEIDIFYIIHPTSNGNTLLHELLQEDSPTNAIQELIEHGADLNAQNNDGYTPLHLAVLNIQDNLVQLFLEKKANKNIQNKYGNTPLHIAIIRYDKNKRAANRKIINHLTQTVFDARIQNCKGNTVIHLAAENEESFFILGDNCLFDQGCILIENLIKHSSGIDLTLTNSDGKTPLHILAAGKNQLNSLKFRHISFLAQLSGLLIDNDPTIIDIVDKNDKTALDIALENNNGQVVDMLCKKGASFEKVLKTVDKNGKMALDSALEKNNWLIIYIFYQKGASLKDAFIRSYHNATLLTFVKNLLKKISTEITIALGCGMLGGAIVILPLLGGRLLYKYLF